MYDLYLEDLETYKLSLRNYKEGLFERMKGLGERERKEIEQNWPRDVLGDFKEGPAGEAEENGKDQMDPATRYVGTFPLLEPGSFSEGRRGIKLMWLFGRRVFVELSWRWRQR